ncbi:D-2-hydroxyacid dehydrogenase [Cytobacillus sp. NCCP-133]|uniref:D-2-hydroxyacid dehydrogenase n=1 Tax=Cytobacillus sp. NCCP-133 TaxID=766848 RepID=UPI00222FFCF8|nr:D-2-hydroxyacid dehydrogenase [Cytobacillus sp. NCCP-133]GLB59836.1 glycerate dehydrogenase [Cytobacillus sp. NCCP-133]
MKVVSSILPPEVLCKDAAREFPEAEFLFYKGMEAAGQSFYEAEIFITYGEDLTEEHIYKTLNLKWIMVMSAGMDEMPLKACKEKGILVTNARGIHKIPMAEFTLGAMLGHVKKIALLADNEGNEVWDRKLPVEELNGKTLLILGVGAIGGEIARLAKCFGMKVAGVNRSGKDSANTDSIYKVSQLTDILPNADFIVSVLPSTAETKYLLQKEHFAAMKGSAVFINIGRGNLVEEDVLIYALETNEIAHAYLDVFQKEPLPMGHPFWKMENVTVTPHLSSKTKNYLPRSFEIFKHNLHTYIKNNKDYINAIDLERGY